MTRMTIFSALAAAVGVTAAVVSSKHTQAHGYQVQGAAAHRPSLVFVPGTLLTPTPAPPPA